MLHGREAVHRAPGSRPLPWGSPRTSAPPTSAADACEHRGGMRPEKREGPPTKRGSELPWQGWGGQPHVLALTHTARELGPDRNRRAGGRKPSQLLTPTTSCLLREDLRKPGARKAAGKEGERGAQATGKGH